MGRRRYRIPMALPSPYPCSSGDVKGERGAEIEEQFSLQAHGTLR